MSQTTVPLSRSTEPVSDTPLPASIRLLRRLNPLVTGVLRSPVHGILSRNLLVLTYVGRKTGRRRAVPLSYVEHGGRLYLCSRTALWWRNLRGGSSVELCLRGRRLAATACVVDPGSTEALD